MNQKFCSLFPTGVNLEAAAKTFSDRVRCKSTHGVGKESLLIELVRLLLLKNVRRDRREAVACPKCAGDILIKVISRTALPPFDPVTYRLMGKSPFLA